MKHRMRPWVCLRGGGKMAFPLLAALMLAACAPAAPWQQPYGLGPVAPAPPRSPGNPPAGPRLPVLELDTLDGPPWLHSTRYQYRLQYLDPQAIRYYATARWEAPPGRMLQVLLAQDLRGSGRWKAILTGGDGQARLVLRVHLHHFLLDFTGPSRGRAEAGVTATLMEATDYQVLAQKDFSCSVPMKSASPAGGAAAMAAASREIARHVTGWAAVTAVSRMLNH